MTAPRDGKLRSWRWGAAAGVLVVAIGLAVAQHSRSSSAVPSVADGGAAGSAALDADSPSFAVLAVADDVPWLVDFDEGTLPAGAALRDESVGLTGAARKAVRYVFFPRRAGAAFDEQRHVEHQWILDRLTPPPGRRVALGYEGSESSGGFRTYLLEATPLLGPEHVSGAHPAEPSAGEPPMVVVRLTADGRETLRRATARYAQRRVALIAQGLVRVAPIVVQEIDVPELTIVLADDATRDDAERLSSMVAPDAARNRP